MTVATLFFGLAALGSLMLPGWMLARAWRVPLPPVAGFILGCVTLHGVVLVFTTFDIPLQLETCGGAWLLWTVAAACLSRWQSAASIPPVSDRAGGWREYGILLLPLLPAFAAIAYRACAQPLSGVDTIGRWNYLAELMLAKGTLNFYPPVTAADYEIYAWVDGISPQVSVLYFWAYTLGGVANPALTAPIVAFQGVALATCVHRLASNLQGPKAAACAIAILAGSPLVLWSGVIGHETGLMSIAVVGLLVYLPSPRSDERLATVVIAGCCAGLGGLAREYGLFLPVFGFMLCLARRLSRRTCGVFALVAAASAGPWYVRNWILTGNPLFGSPTGRWFPGNEVYAKLVESQRAGLGWSALPDGALPQLIANASLPLLGGAIGFALFLRRARALGFLALTIVLLWLLAVPHTAAGFTYASRVLCPALALGAVVGGCVCAHWISRPRQLALAGAILGVFALDAAIRTLALPAKAYRLHPSQWLTIGGMVQAFHERPIYREIASLAGPHRILSHGPNSLLNRQGARTLPFWSPEVAYLFGAGGSAAQIARRLRADGIGFILLTKSSLNDTLIDRIPFLLDPDGRLQFVWQDADLLLLRIRGEEEETASAAPR